LPPDAAEGLRAFQDAAGSGSAENVWEVLSADTQAAYEELLQYTRTVDVDPDLARTRPELAAELAALREFGDHAKQKTAKDLYKSIFAATVGPAPNGLSKTVEFDELAPDLLSIYHGLGNAPSTQHPSAASTVLVREADGEWRVIYSYIHAYMEGRVCSILHFASGAVDTPPRPMPLPLQSDSLRALASFREGCATPTQPVEIVDSRHPTPCRGDDGTVIEDCGTYRATRFRESRLVPSYAPPFAPATATGGAGSTDSTTSQGSRPFPILEVPTVDEVLRCHERCGAFHVCLELCGRDNPREIEACAERRCSEYSADCGPGCGNYPLWWGTTEHIAWCRSVEAASGRFAAQNRHPEAADADRLWRATCEVLTVAGDASRVAPPSSDSAPPEGSYCLGAVGMNDVHPVIRDRA